MSKHICPGCGAELNWKFQFTKQIVCEYCNTLLFLDDNAVKNAGTSAALADIPSLLEIGSYFEYNNETYLPLGCMQYEYDYGYWNEYWCLSQQQEGLWISVDEGNIAIEKKLKYTESIDYYDSYYVGAQYKFNKIGRLMCQEKNQAKLVAAAGELPCPVNLGEEHSYIDFISGKGRSFTIQFFNDNTFEIYKGIWIDPFEIKIKKNNK